MTNSSLGWLVSLPNMLAEDSALIWGGAEEQPVPAVIRTWCVADIK